MADIFRCVDVILISLLFFTTDCGKSNANNILSGLICFILICFLNYLMDRGSEAKNSRFYFIHNLSFPILLFSIVKTENSLEPTNSYSIEVFSLFISFSSIFIRVVKDFDFFISFASKLYKFTLFITLSIFLFSNQYGVKIVDAELLAILYHFSTLQYLLSNVNSTDGHTQFSELNILSQIASFQLLISFLNIGAKGFALIKEWRDCIHYITLTVTLLIPLNLVLLSKLIVLGIEKKKNTVSILTNKYLIIVISSTTYISFIPTIIITLSVCTYIINLVYGSNSIKMLLIYWSTVISLLPIILYLLKQINSQEKIKKVLIRKTFHLVLIALFFPPILVCITSVNNDSEKMIQFTIISIYLASSAFIYLEVMRKSNYFGVSESINKFLLPFLDSKDSIDGLIITHICLLIGISLPIFKEFLIKKNLRDIDIISATIGIATIGVGDAFSAIFGVQFGKISLPGNRAKTLFGMVSFFLTTYLYLWLTCFLSSTRYSLPKLLIICFFSSILEAYTHYIDNASIPMYSLTLYTNIR
ncbi:phosphatidate cytidylyltransferase family protein [Cryptosporidium felis]|nr:phosphatidate cytidylyltransferase family protein [Cryptosporidium felis]